MTKIDVFSGFLGAGKTTLIKKLLKEALDGSKTVLIENEFGEIGIDGGFLKEAGIEIKLNLSEYNAWAQKVGPEGNYMMEAQGGFMGPDPAALATRYGTGSNSNYAGWSNAEFDALCAEGAATGDTEKRAELYKAAQKLIIEELPAINVVGYASYTVCPANLKNVPEDGAGQWGWFDWNYAYFE